MDVGVCVDGESQHIVIKGQDQREGFGSPVGRMLVGLPNRGGE